MQPVNLVRLDIGGLSGWRSFRGVSKRERAEHDWDGAFGAELDRDVVSAPDGA